MPPDIKIQPFWDKLNFVIKTLTLDIYNQKNLILHNKLISAIRSKRGIIFILILLILSVFIVRRFTVDTSYIFIALIADGIIYLILDPVFFGPIKNDNFEEIRKNLIEVIGINFCECTSECKCKDQYTEYMYNKGIDLVHK